MINKITPNKGLFITGTDTDVGKTYIGAQIVSLLHDNTINAVPRKPIESGCKRVGNELEPEDARQYFEAAHKKYSLAEICPFRFEPAISPQRAARLINQPVFLNDVVKTCTAEIADDDFLVVEGAGGFYSPLCEDGNNADLAKKLSLPVLLVANDRLGCINHILLTAEAIKYQGLSLLAIILNQITDTSSSDGSMNNFEDITTLIDTPAFFFPNNKYLIHQPILSAQFLKLLVT